MWASGAYGYLSDYLGWWIVFVSLTIHTWCFFRFFPRRRFRKLGLLLGNALILMTMLGVVGLVGESYVRFLVVETDAFGASLVSKRWFLIYPQLNSLYCRDREWTEQKPPGVRRIAFVGDSFTYGWGINDAADRFTDVIQSRFEAQSPGAIEVMNVAWAGWDTRAELGAVHDMIRDYDVDEIVLAHVSNDIEPLLPVSSEFDPKKAPKSRFVNTESSFLLDYLYHRVIATRASAPSAYWDWLADGYSDPEIWGRQQRLFDQIIQQCADHDVRLRVVLLPFIQTEGTRYDAAAIHGRLAAFFAARNVPLVDLLGQLSGRNAYELVVSSHDPHPNEAAHQLFVDAIWNAFFAARGSSTGSGSH